VALQDALRTVDTCDDMPYVERNFREPGGFVNP